MLQLRIALYLYFVLYIKYGISHNNLHQRGGCLTTWVVSHLSLVDFVRHLIVLLTLQVFLQTSFYLLLLVVISDSVELGKALEIDAAGTMKGQAKKDH